MKTLVIIFVSVILGFVIGFNLHNCKKNTNNGGEKNSDTIWIDTGSVKIEIIPMPYKVDSIIYKDKLIYEKIDSFEIVKDYLLKKYYLIDTTINEVSLNIPLEVQFNKLLPFKMNIKNNRITQINKTIIKQNKRFYAGISIGGSSENFDIMPMFGYRNKNLMYQIQYTVYQKQIYFGTALVF